MSSGLQLQQSSPKPALLSTAHPPQGAECHQLAQRSPAVGSAQHHSGSLQQTGEGPKYFPSAPTKWKGNLALKSATPWCSHIYQETYSQLQKDEESWKRMRKRWGQVLQWVCFQCYSTGLPQLMLLELPHVRVMAAPKKILLEENSVVNSRCMPCRKRQEDWRPQHFKAHILTDVMPKPVRDAGNWLRHLQH